MSSNSVKIQLVVKNEREVFVSERQDYDVCEDVDAAGTCFVAY